MVDHRENDHRESAGRGRSQGRDVDHWRADEVLAWTEREGPGRGPSGGSRRLWFLLAGAMAVVFLGIMSSDALCPEHRLWVLLLGGASLIAAGTAIVGLIDGWVGAPLLALASALGGVGIGVIDTIHSPDRGRLIALGFGLVFAGACCLVCRQSRQRRWDRVVARSLASPPPPQVPAASAVDTGAGDPSAVVEQPVEPGLPVRP